jgi:hypothetical protein
VPISTTTPTTIDGQLWPIAAAAVYVRLSVRSFAGGIKKGQIPVPVVRVGNRRFVRRVDLLQWANPQTADNSDLF